MTKIYIAGKISGLPYETAKRNFRNAKRYLLLNHTDCKVVNPMEMPKPCENPTWSDWMRVCVAELSDCDYIYMLPNWRRSRGAWVERLLALILKINRMKT